MIIRASDLNNNLFNVRPAALAGVLELLRVTPPTPATPLGHFAAPSLHSLPKFIFYLFTEVTPWQLDVTEWAHTCSVIQNSTTYFSFDGKSARSGICFFSLNINSFVNQCHIILIQAAFIF